MLDGSWASCLRANPEHLAKAKPERPAKSKDPGVVEEDDGIINF